MQHLSIPACYFPSTALFIDDSRDFLLNFILQLDEGLAYRIYNSPFNALDFIQKQQAETGTFHDRCVRYYQDCFKNSLTASATDLSLNAVQSELYNKNRFSDVSVVIVDYGMPGIDGLSFCRHLSNTPIKKILLTGQADEKLAVEAFNEGIIHRFIHKNEEDVGALITQAISELQQQYFHEISEKAIHSLGMVKPACLMDKKFAAYFKEFCQENHIIEYYLADNNGSFLMLNEDAKISLLTIKHEEDLNTLYQKALEKGAANEVLDDLAKGRKLPIYTQTLNDNWLSSLVPAKHFVGDKNYYYAYTQELSCLALRQADILSYHQHLEAIDAEELLLL